MIYLKIRINQKKRAYFFSLVDYTFFFFVKTQNLNKNFCEHLNLFSKQYITRSIFKVQY